MYNAATSTKEFASWVGVDPEKLIALLQDYPDLHFWKRRKSHPRHSTLIFSDVEKLKELLPMAKRKELSL